MNVNWLLAYLYKDRLREKAVKVLKQLLKWFKKTRITFDTHSDTWYGEIDNELD